MQNGYSLLSGAESRVTLNRSKEDSSSSFGAIQAGKHFLAHPLHDYRKFLQAKPPREDAITISAV